MDCNSSVQVDINNFDNKIMIFEVNEGRYPTTTTELSAIASPSSVVSDTFQLR
jgi:hypothetical protein